MNINFIKPLKDNKISTMYRKHLINIKRNLFIKNKINNPCVNCINFIEDKYNYPYDPIPKTSDGKCKLFGKYDPVSGNPLYDFAYNCRIDDNKCGINGKYFKSN